MPNLPHWASDGFLSTCLDIQNAPLATMGKMGYNAALSSFRNFSCNMFDSLVFFAEAGGEGGGGNSGLFMFFIMLPALLLIMWILMVNPSKKQEERLRRMLSALEKNDKVMTVGGVIGTVHSIDKEQNEIVLKVDDANNTRIRFHLTAISVVFPKDGGGNK